MLETPFYALQGRRLARRLVNGVSRKVEVSGDCITERASTIDAD